MDKSSSSDSSVMKGVTPFTSPSSSSSRFTGSPLTPAQKRSRLNSKTVSSTRLRDDTDEVKRHNNVLSLMFLMVLVSVFLMWSFDICCLSFAKRVFVKSPTRHYNKSPADGVTKPSTVESNLDGVATEAKNSVAEFFESAGRFRCPQSRRFTREEVAQHHTADDLWIVIDGNVLDVSLFIGQHPGGLVLLDGAGGQDMATVFARSHHPSSVGLFANFCIGQVRE